MRENISRQANFPLTGDLGCGRLLEQPPIGGFI